MPIVAGFLCLKRTLLARETGRYINAINVVNHGIYAVTVLTAFAVTQDAAYVRSPSWTRSNEVRIVCGFWALK